MSLSPKKDIYTYEEWMELDNNEDTELIDGVVYMRYETKGGARAGASRRHQKVSRKLTQIISNFLEDKSCELYYDLMVKLSSHTVVRPDIAVICDPEKLDDQGCNGAPDLIIEILSHSNAGNDLWLKYNKYLIAGVREYWIVDPIKNEVTVYVLENGKYRGAWYSEKNTISVTVLPGCKIDLSAIFLK